MTMNGYPRMKWKRNHKSEQPSRLIFVDCETLAYPSQQYKGHEQHVLRLGYATLWTRGKTGFAKRDELRFTTQYEFWQWFYNAMRTSRPTWVYGHNLGFDWTILGGFNELDQGKLWFYEQSESRLNIHGAMEAKVSTWRGKLAIEGSPFLLELRSNRGPCKWVDTYNFFPMPLSKLGEWVSIPKKEVEYFASDPEAIWEYCTNDVRIIEAAMIRLMNYWKEQNLGNWQMTAASLSFSSFRHCKEACTIVAHGDSDDEVQSDMYANNSSGVSPLSPKGVSDVERRSYYGGRTECYYVGDCIAGAVAGWERTSNLYSDNRPVIPGPITVVDVNSMYAYVMKEYKHPYELLDAIRFPKMSEAQRHIRDFFCCADVEIRTNEESYPKRTGRGIIYPSGSFSTTLCGPELLRAVETGSLLGITNLCIYYTGRPFANFITDWHKRRCDAIDANRDAEQRFCNLIMQSMYGKLAQLTPAWNTCGHIVPPVRWGLFFAQTEPGGSPCLMRSIGGVSQYQTVRKSCRHTFTAGAASVTSAARTYMRHLIGICPPNSVVYTDTDSLFCLPPAIAALQELCLIHPTELGKLKVKGTYQTVRIWGHKDYELDGVRVIAGLRADAKQLSERLWEQVNFEGVKSIIQSEPDGMAIMRKTLFSPCNQLHSRAVNYDGWTKPIHLE